MLPAKLLVALQQGAAALSLLVAVRFTFVEARALVEGLDHPAPPVGGSADGSAQSGASGPADPAEMVRTAAQTREQVLDQFREELASAVPATPAPPAVRQRHIFVDLGPARSNVYIAGKLVGQTPFGGQISCVEGGGVEVVVLPEHGAPIKRLYECRTEPSPSPAGAPGLPELLQGQSVSNLKPSPGQ